MPAFATRTWTAGELVTASIASAQWDDNLDLLAERVIGYSFGDRTGAVLTTGVAGYLPVPFACTIHGWTIVADAVGSIVIDVWKDTYANFPPTVADTIAGTEKPTLSAVQKNQDLTLSSWTTALAAGDVLAFNIDSVATVKQAMLILHVRVA